MTKLGKISNVSIIEGIRDRRTGRIPTLNGLVIEFKTEHLIHKNNIICIDMDKTVHTFRIAEIEIDGNSFLCKCVVYGYYNRLDKKDNFDIRTLIDVDVELIEDTKILDKLREESLWT